MSRIIIHNTMEQFFWLFREFGLDVQVLVFDESQWDAIRYQCIMNKNYSLYNYAVLLARAGIIKILSDSSDMIVELQEEISNEK